MGVNRSTAGQPAPFAEDSSLDDLQDATPDNILQALKTANRASSFKALEKRGLHATLVHFYSPVPDTQTLADSVWNAESQLPGIDLNVPVQLNLLCEVFPRYQSECAAIPYKATPDSPAYYFENGRFGGTDALAYYCMIRHFQPRRVVEIGSGFSTRIAAQAALANGDTNLECIDPFPEDVTRKGYPGLNSVLESEVQNVPLTYFAGLAPSDILFIDSSHVVKIGSDVTYLFLEVIPRLRPGVIVHVHDIFFPKEYPRSWVMEELRFWNEQYLLQAFLAFNSAFEVLLCNSYLGVKHRDRMQATFPVSPWWGGGSFWMRKKL